MARRALFALALAASLASCTSVNYYAQAAHGQLSLLSDARPVDEVIADSSTDPKLRLRLEKARQIRRFAVTALGLPDNRSYTNYTALARPFVLWNVVATPELSLKPMQWCFPVAGCVSYRGYYGKQDAQDYGNALRAEGMDVQVAGVTAYSTLGWFNDPLISTFINYADAELARLIFHELAHQVVYVKGDSRFNESFATAVEEAGVQQWLDQFGNETMRANYAKYVTRKQEFQDFLLKYRRQLEAVYASRDSAADKRAAKARLFQQIKDEYPLLKQHWDGYAGYDRFFAEPLSNAHLAAIATYSDLVPAFRALLAREHSFPAFYAAARALALLEREERNARLKQLAGCCDAASPNS
ncbi:MAG: aminopeptidase [Pseudomonadota bacterium]